MQESKYGASFKRRLLIRTLKNGLLKCCAYFSIFFIISSLFLIICFIVNSGIPSFVQTKIKTPETQYEQYKFIISEPEIAPNTWYVTKAKFDYYYKHHNHGNKEFDDAIKSLKELGAIKKSFNISLFTNTDSFHAEKSGMLGALKGSLYTFLVYFAVISTFGVMSGIYIAEYIKSQRLKSFIELNINNLIGIPSVIYGLLGLSFFITFLGLPRSSPLVGGLTLSLLLLPFVSIITKQAFENVPQFLRDSSMSLGANKTQTIFRVLLPVALPRIVTALLLAILRGFGETAPLLIIGMAMFVQSSSLSFLAPSTSLPIQIYLWINDPQNSFIEKSAGAILVLFAILGIINILGSIIRAKLSVKTKF